MLADDEVLRTGGTPRDLSCCGIELQAQIAVHVFPIFQINARCFFLLVRLFFGLHFRCL